MRVIVRTSRKSQTLRLRSGAAASDALVSMRLSLTHHLILRKGAPIPSDEPLADGDTIDIVEVFSGG
jgi:sulfur carrier protein ThiS